MGDQRWIGRLVAWLGILAGSVIAVAAVVRGWSLKPEVEGLLAVGLVIVLAVVASPFVVRDIRRSRDRGERPRAPEAHDPAGS